MDEKSPKQPHDEKTSPSKSYNIDLKVNDWVIALYGKRKKEIISKIISFDQNYYEVQFINWREKDNEHPNGKLFHDTYKLPYDDIKKKIDFNINILYVDKTEQWKRTAPYKRKNWALIQDECFKNATSALNKLTPENFDKISGKFLEDINQIQIFDDKKLFEEFIRDKDHQEIQEIKKINLIAYEKFNTLSLLIIDKAGLFKNFTSVYAELCKEICEKIKHDLFKFFLLKNCRVYFQRNPLLKSIEIVNEIRNEKDLAEKNAKKLANELKNAKRDNMEALELKTLILKAKNANDKVEDEKYKLDEEIQKLNYNKKLYVNHIIFIGELFKASVIKCKIINECIEILFQDPEDWKIECICNLLTTVGENFEKMQKVILNPKELLELYISNLEEIKQNKLCSSRIRFMILDLLELRARNWKLKSSEHLPKKINEIRKDFKIAEL